MGSGTVLSVLQTMNMLGIPRYADNSLVVCRNPDIALPVLADVAYVAASEVVFTFFHGKVFTGIVWIYDTHTISASYPHRLVFRFENSINEIFFYVVRIGVVQTEGFFFLRFDDDTVAVDGKPYFIIASFHDAGDIGGKSNAAQFAKARNAFIIIGFTGLSIVECYSVWIES